MNHYVHLESTVIKLPLDETLTNVRDCSLFIGSTGPVFRGTGQGHFLMLPSTPGTQRFFVFLWYGT